MKQVLVKVRPKRREHDEPERDYGDPAIVKAKRAKRESERKS